MPEFYTLAFGNRIRKYSGSQNRNYPRTDALILLQIDRKILHLEFQTLPYSDPPMPYRMLKYWTLLYGQYWCDIEQVVIYLKETGSELALQDRFQQQNTQHRYRVIRMWEQEPDFFLSDRALLPLATLTRSPSGVTRRLKGKEGKDFNKSPQKRIELSCADNSSKKCFQNYTRKSLKFI